MTLSAAIKVGLLLIVCATLSNSLFINLDARNPQCFYKSLTKGHVLTMLFCFKKIKSKLQKFNYKKILFRSYVVSG